MVPRKDGGYHRFQRCLSIQDRNRREKSSIKVVEVIRVDQGARARAVGSNSLIGVLVRRK